MSHRTIVFKEYEAAARVLKIQLQSLDVLSPNPDLDGVFRAAIKGRAGAVVVLADAPSSLFTAARGARAKKSASDDLRAKRIYVEAGCLMSYAANDARDVPTRRNLRG